MKKDFGISEDDEKWLSSRLYPLGDRWQDICNDLLNSGFGEVALALRKFCENLTRSDDELRALHTYWSEYAKERLAALRGPLNVLTGDLPIRTTYHSDYLEKLRVDVASGKVRSEGDIISPQIEPTLKKFLENCDPNLTRDFLSILKASRKNMADKIDIQNPINFSELSGGRRQTVLLDRYNSKLVSDGFQLKNHGSSGVVFGKPTTNGKLDFLIVDSSRSDDLTRGVICISFILALPEKRVAPGGGPKNAIATIPSELLVPYFDQSTTFDRDSYSEFCLATDTVAAYAKIAYSYIDKAISAG